MKKFLGISLVVSIVAILCVVFILVSSTNDYVMVGESMTPTISEGQELTVEPIGSEGISRGDIVIFNHYVNENSNKTQLVKRIVGLPGDTISVSDGVLKITSSTGNQYVPYPNASEPNNIDSVTLGDDEYYVTGDNQSAGASLDSRNQLGLVKYENIVGVVDID